MRVRPIAPSSLAAVLVVALGPVGHADARGFQKGPYLQNVSPRSITLVWESSCPAAAQVHLLAVTPPRAIGVEPDEDELYEVVIDDLEPGRRYRYQVECDGAFSEGEFATAPDAGAPFSFVVFGDTRSNARVHQRVVDRIRQEIPDFILSTGDLVDDGGREKQWQEFFDVERELLAENVLFPAVGNHDRQGRGRTADNFRKYFALPENSPDPERYYAFTYAGARFLVLDSNAYSFALTDQTAWLQSQLAATQLDPAIRQVFVTMHHPPFSVSLHGGQSELRERWTPLFEQYGVTAVFSGHDHVYSRAEHGGVRYYVSGGGGAPLYPRSRRPGKLDSSATRYFERVSHYLRIHVIGDLVEISAIRVDGSLIETASWTANSGKPPLVASVGGADRPRVDVDPADPAGAADDDAPSPAMRAGQGAARHPRPEPRRGGFGLLGVFGAFLIVLAGGVLIWTLRS